MAFSSTLPPGLEPERRRKHCTFNVSITQEDIPFTDDSTSLEHYLTPFCPNNIATNKYRYYTTVLTASDIGVIVTIITTPFIIRK